MKTFKHGLTTVKLGSKQEIVEYKRKKDTVDFTWANIKMTFYIMAAILLFMYVASNVGTQYAKDPLTGFAFTGGFIYGFWKLCEHFQDRYES